MPITPKAPPNKRNSKMYKVPKGSKAPKGSKFSKKSKAAKPSKASKAPKMTQSEDNDKFERLKEGVLASTFGVPSQEIPDAGSFGSEDSCNFNKATCTKSRPANNNKCINRVFIQEPKWHWRLRLSGVLECTTSNDLLDEISKACDENKLCVVFYYRYMDPSKGFYYRYMDPSKKISKLIEDMAIKLHNVKFIMIDGDTASSQMKDFIVLHEELPVFILFRNGKKVGQVMGHNWKQVKEAIENYLFDYWMGKTLPKQRN